MKHLFFLWFAFLVAGCGISSKEKESIATATCNVISEYASDAGALSIKELNAAREKIGEPLFLNSSDAIKEAIKYELCLSLVLNDDTYAEKLAAAKEERISDSMRFLSGFWLYQYDSGALRGSFSITAEFVNERLVLTRYFEDAEYDAKQQVTVFKTEVLDEDRVIASSASLADMLISVNRLQGSLKLDISDCGENEMCVFSRPPLVALDDLQGFWTNIVTPLDEESHSITHIVGSRSTIKWRYLDHIKKTYKDSIDACEFTLKHGFLVTEICVSETETEPYSYFIIDYAEASDEITYSQLAGNYPWNERRVGSDYTFAPPPQGYEDLSAP